MASADWSSLPADLLNRIAECFLPTSDLDYYMDFRAVCQSWRSATEDPKNSSDPRFRPHQWVMITEVYGSATRLLVNTTTGRFLRKEPPLLQNYFVTTATSDGLLILMDRNSTHAVSVLNPFTGYLIYFTAPLPVNILESAALVSGSSPKLILVCKKMHLDENRDVFILRESSCKVYMADPDSESFAAYEETDACPLTRLAVRGICTNREFGPVTPFPNAVAKRIFDLMRISNAGAAETSEDEDTIISDEEGLWNFRTGYDNRCFLVESAGEILIIIRLPTGMDVYKMDTDRYILKRVHNIDNRAIFLGGYCRCISVNADKFPSIDANCIYYIKGLDLWDGIYKYNVMSQREELIYEGGRSYGSPTYTAIINLFNSLRAFNTSAMVLG